MSLPFEYEPGEMNRLMEQMKPYNTEAMRIAALMKAARDANKAGDKVKGQMYAFTISTMMSVKSQDELMMLATAALNLVSTLAEQVTSGMAENLVTEVEKMLKEGNT